MIRKVVWILALILLCSSVTAMVTLTEIGASGSMPSSYPAENITAGQFNGNYNVSGNLTVKDKIFGYLNWSWITNSPAGFTDTWNTTQQMRDALTGTANLTKSSYKNITDIPTCTGTDKLTFDGTTLECDTDSDSGADGNNYPTGVYVSGTTTKNVTITRSGLSNITAIWTDIDTDTDTWNTTAQMIAAVNGTALNLSLAYGITETDPVFVANRTSIWNQILYLLDSNSTQATLLGTLVTSNSSMNTRVSALETSNTTMDSRVDNLESSNTTMDSRMDLMESSNTSQASLINGKAMPGTCASGAVQNTSTSGVQCATTTQLLDKICTEENKIIKRSGSAWECADMTTDTWNTTAQMRAAVNNTGVYNITVNASTILNAPWLTSYTDTNESVRFNNLTGTDCDAGYFAKGVDSGGTLVCAEDQVGDPGSSDGNNYTMGVYVSGTTTKNITLTRYGMDNLTAIWTDIDTDTWNTTEQMVAAANNTALNLSFAYGYTETDPVFVANRTSIWNQILYLLDSNSTQATAIANLVLSNTSISNRVAALESSNTTMDSRMDLMESSNTSQASLISLLTTSNTTMDGRMDNIESSNTTMDGRVDNLESSNTTMDGRMDLMESSNTTQASLISGLLASNSSLWTTKQGIVSTYPAANITTGTFGAGDYTFPANLTVNSNILLPTTGTCLVMAGGKLCSNSTNIWMVNN